MATQLALRNALFASTTAPALKDAWRSKTGLMQFLPQMSFHFDDKIPLDLSDLMQNQPAGSAIYIQTQAMIEANAPQPKVGHTAKIFVELFSTPQDSSEDTLEVEIHSTGEVFTIPIGQSIIDVLTAEGKDILYDCQRGDCICQTDVISGVPDHRDVVLSRQTAYGQSHANLRKSAKSARLVLDL